APVEPLGRGPGWVLRVRGSDQALVLPTPARDAGPDQEQARGDFLPRALYGAPTKARGRKGHGCVWKAEKGRGGTGGLSQRYCRGQRGKALPPRTTGPVDQCVQRVYAQAHPGESESHIDPPHLQTL